MMTFLRITIVYVLLVVTLITTIGTAAAAYVFHSGFELSTTDEWTGVVGAPSIQDTVAHSGEYAMQCNTSATTAYLGYEASTYITRFSAYLRVGSAPDTDCIVFGHNSMTHLYLTTTREIDVYDSNSGKVADGTTQLALDTWYLINGSIDRTNDEVSVWIGGDLEHDAVSIYEFDDYWAYGAVGHWRAGIMTSCTADLYFDDIIIDDTEEGAASLGDIRILASLPNSDGYHDDWTAVGNSTDKWENVNEIPVNEADYNWWDCDGTQQEQTHSTANCTMLGIDANDEVEAVSSWYWYKTAGGGDGDYATLVRDNSTDYFDWTIPDIKTAGWASRYDATMPNGGGNWTQTRFDAFEIGMATDDANKDIWMYEAVAMVAYEEVAAPPAYNVIVTSAGATLYENLEPSSNITWGLELWTPTEFLDGAEKTGTVTLTASLAT